MPEGAMIRGARISSTGTTISRFADDELQRRSRMAVSIAYRLSRTHRDWTWTRIANEARRQAGLGPLLPWEQG